MNDRTILLRWSEERRSALCDLILKADTVASEAAVLAESLIPEEPTHLERARAVLYQRQQRAQTFGKAGILFNDPAWEILLDLFIAYEEGRPVIIADLSRMAIASPTGIGRWVRAMEQEGLVGSWVEDARPDERAVALTPKAIGIMLRFLSDI